MPSPSSRSAARDASKVGPFTEIKPRAKQQTRTPHGCRAGEALEAEVKGPRGSPFSLGAPRR